MLLTDHCYPATLAQVKRAVAASGAEVRVAEVPLSIGDQATVLAAVTARLGPARSGAEQVGRLVGTTVPGGEGPDRGHPAGAATA